MQRQRGRSWSYILVLDGTKAWVVRTRCTQLMGGLKHDGCALRSRGIYSPRCGLGRQGRAAKLCSRTRCRLLRRRRSHPRDGSLSQNTPFSRSCLCVSAPSSRHCFVRWPQAATRTACRPRFDTLACHLRSADPAFAFGAYAPLLQAPEVTPAGDAPLFAPVVEAEAGAGAGAADDEDGEAPQEEATAEFAPLVQLAEVTTSTGEEDEEDLFTVCVLQCASYCPPLCASCSPISLGSCIVVCCTSAWPTRAFLSPRCIPSQSTQALQAVPL